MSFTVYGLTSAATAPGPYASTSDVTAIGASAPAVGAFLYGFASGQQLSKFFFSSDSGALALPQFVVPNALPTGAVPVASGCAIYQSQYTDINGNLKGGALYFAVQPQAGSPDAGSPQQFEVDPYTVFLVSSTGTNYEWA